MKCKILSGFGLMLALAGHSAMAAGELDGLLKAKKYAEVEKLTGEKLMQDSNDAQALATKANLIAELALEDRLDEGRKAAEQCIAAHPQESVCYESLGNILGTKALLGGVMSALGYATRIRDAYLKAIELDPANMNARGYLLQYYVQAPGIVGGGHGKAEKLVAETSKGNAEAGKLLQAELDLYDNKSAHAMELACAVTPGSDAKLANRQQRVLINLGYSYLGEKKFSDAENAFREIQKRFGTTIDGAFGLARVLQMQGKFSDAIGAYDNVLHLQSNANVYYRIGQTWQSLNDRTKAVAAYEKALSFKLSNLSKKLRDDAQQQLNKLKL